MLLPDHGNLGCFSSLSNGDSSLSRLSLEHYFTLILATSAPSRSSRIESGDEAFLSILSKQKECLYVVCCKGGGWTRDSMHNSHWGIYQCWVPVGCCNLGHAIFMSRAFVLTVPSFVLERGAFGRTRATTVMDSVHIYRLQRKGHRSLWGMDRVVEWNEWCSGIPQYGN